MTTAMTANDQHAHMVRLRALLQRSINTLEEQRAQYGIDVPTAIVNEIAQKRAELREVENALQSPISTEFAETLGTTGQYQAMSAAIHQLRAALMDSAHWRDEEQRAYQEDERAWQAAERQERRIYQRRRLRWLQATFGAVVVLVMIAGWIAVHS